MANKIESVIAEEPIKEKITKKDNLVEEKYDTQELIDNCKALGYNKAIVAGALFDCKKTEMTKTEFKVTIDKFLKGRVK